MLFRALFTVVIGVTVAAQACAQPSDVFRFDGRKPTRILLTETTDIDLSLPLESPMLQAVAGVQRVLAGSQVNRLLQCVGRRGQPGETEDVCFVFVEGIDTSKWAKIVRNDQGDYFASPVTADDTSAGFDWVRLRLDRLEALLATATPRRPTVPSPLPGRQQALDHPYVAAATMLDERTLTRRLYRGMSVRVDGTDRVLPDEQFHIRIPHDYSPHESPAGLLVWSSPTPDGRIPNVLTLALDELNLVCIGIDNAGNDRDTQDKLQLVLDAAATGQQLFHIDSRRVYVAGLSGGGKVSSIMTTCFPEVFTGAVPIVGLASHHALGDQWGQHRYGYFATPVQATLAKAATRPMAVMTGPLDFNYEEMKERTRLLQGDGFGRIKCFDHPSMGHAMPTSGQFLEAMVFVDEPFQESANTEQTQAEGMLDAYLLERTDPPPVTQVDRSKLIEITRVGPWTKAAWRAVELLWLGAGFPLP